MKAIAALGAFLVLAVTAGAVEPGEMLKDPALEARARVISKALRCVQCQNESIDESHAEIARDMRLLVRQRLAAGDSDTEIVSYMVSRYGDYVLLTPRFTGKTVLLWLGPMALLLLGGLAVRRRLKAAPATPAPPLTDEERATLDLLSSREEKP